MKWLYLGWYQYLFAPMKSRYNDQWFWRLRMIWCRSRGHAPVVWFSSGYEPDMTCSCCGENLG